MQLGSGQFVYEEADGWGEVPAGWEIVEAPGVAVDSQDRVYAFCRSEHPVIVFDREGRFLRSWGEGLIKRAHDIIVGRTMLSIAWTTGATRCTSSRPRANC